MLFRYLTDLIQTRIAQWRIPVQRSLCLRGLYTVG